MRLVVTGGGTGGHVYPALEVARLAAERGMDLRYFGSLRGQEGSASAARNIPFQGFASEPLYSLKTVRGVRALIRLELARRGARRVLAQDRPDVIFSTGGYSAGPIVAAARDLKIPYIVHSADSIPPRSSAMFAKEAFAFTTVFRSTSKFFAARPVTRTGQPIRDALRQASAARTNEHRSLVLVLGGSQGSEFLNTVVPKAAAGKGFGAPVLHACGPKHLEVTQRRVNSAMPGCSYEVVPYLDTPDLVSAMTQASVVIARAGGTLAELALFGIPGVIVPLPNSANGHQQQNAVEFEEMRAASVLRQAEDKWKAAPPATPDTIADAVAKWISDGAARAAARHNLRDWDVPNATSQIVDLIESAARSGSSSR